MVAALIAIGFVLNALTPAETAHEEHIADALQDLEVAWRNADFDAVGDLAVDAMALIEASECPWRSDAAVAAFMGGVGSYAQNAARPGYLFWVASRVDRHAGVLQSAQAQVADGLKSGPGARVDEDQLFIASVYRNDPAPADCATRQLDPDLLSYEPSNPEAVFVVTTWPQVRRRVRWSRGRYLYAYPEKAGRQLASQVISQDGFSYILRTMEPRLFNPCSRFTVDNLTSQSVCWEPDAETP